MERSKLACPNLCSTASLQYCSIFYISNLQTICSEHSEICHFHEAQEARAEGLGSVSSFQDFCSRWKARHLKHSSTPFCVADCRMCRRWWWLKHIHIHWQEAEFIRYTPNPNAHQPCFFKQKLLTWLRFDSGFDCLRFQNLWLRPGYTPNCREHVLVAAVDVQEHRASAVLGRSTRALQRNLTCERISLQYRWKFPGEFCNNC